MEFDNFDELYQYVSSHTLAHLLVPALKNEIMKYDSNIIDSEGIQDLIERVNGLTIGQYNIILGDAIYTEIADIKENLEKYLVLNKTMLQDQKSKEVLFNILAFRLTRMQKYILNAYSYDSEQYFDPDVLPRMENCVFVDCGGLDGYTTAKFILNFPSYRKIYLYEPIEEYYQECVRNVETFQVNNIVVRKAAVTTKSGTLNFSTNKRGSSKVDDSGDVIVHAVSLDEDIKEPVHFIKMDIEGSEKQAIMGAEQHIKKDSPMLAICVYHLPSDLWQIPYMVAEMNPNYFFHLRHHQTFFNETVVYAIPKQSNSLQNNNHQVISKTTELACNQLIYQTELSEREELLKSKVYLLNQLDNYRRNEIQQESIISEMNYWNKQLNEAKLYLEDQVTNRENSIDELHNWNKQLNEAKRYLEEQVKSRDISVEELHNWISQVEEAKEYHLSRANHYELENKELRQGIVDREDTIDNLINEKKKVIYFLKEEAKKPWYKKLFSGDKDLDKYKEYFN